jgi:hypothetical protein
MQRYEKILKQNKFLKKNQLQMQHVNATLFCE